VKPPPSGRSTPDAFAAAADVLAALDEIEARRLIRAARARRRRRRDEALRAIGACLAGLPERDAAKIIDRAARGRRVNGTAESVALSAEVRRRLVAELGVLDDIPGEERIRQLIDKG
jgi:hypothetical protein